MIFEPAGLDGAYIVKLERRGDARGAFARSFCVEEFKAHGLETTYVQQNVSVSTHKGTLRGMHYQRAPHQEVKLIRCARGALYDVLIDLRPDSSTFRKWIGVELSADNGVQLYAPRGVAHGFLTLTDDVEATYLVSAAYAPGAEGGVRHDDPAFGVVWPGPVAVISDKDAAWPDYAGP